MDIQNSPIPAWLKIVHDRDLAGLSAILAEDVVFFSPVIHTPQTGKALTAMYLAGAASVLLNGTFHYVREVIGEHDAVLEFMAEIDGVTINGVDIIKWNDEGKISEFKVMLRPLKAVSIIQEKMRAMLATRSSGE